MRHVVHFGEGIFDVPDGAWSLLHKSSNTIIPLAALPCRPLHSVVGTHYSPLWRDGRQVAGEQETGPRAIRTVNHGDGQIRESYARIGRYQSRIIPLLGIPKINVSQLGTGEFDLATGDSRNIDHWDDATDHCGELKQAKRF